MLTLEQIDAIHDRLGNAETFLGYVLALREIGVERCDTYLSDGHSEYHGADGHTLSSPAVHETFAVAATSDREGFLRHLRLHESGQTDYLTMSRGLAESGIEKWTIDTVALTMTYSDRTGAPLLVEAIA